MTTPNGIQTESARIPFASIEVPTRHVTSRISRGAMHASHLTSACPRPVDNADLASPTARHDAWALRAEFGGGR